MLILQLHNAITADCVDLHSEKLSERERVFIWFFTCCGLNNDQATGEARVV